MTKLPYPTPHIQAKPEDFAKTVLMPGDPLLSRYIAENFLESAVQVNNVRGVEGYTGTYRGVRVSVMASGMGMPSIGIYSNELYRFFGVENIIRVGSAGALAQHVKLRDLILGMGACTDSAYAAQYAKHVLCQPILVILFLPMLFITHAKTLMRHTAVWVYWPWKWRQQHCI